MAVRIKTHWHNDEAQRSTDEIAGAIAFNAWRIALDKAIHLHGEDFVYENDGQRLAVIAEYLIFIAQMADRMAHDSFDDADRRELVTALALRMADHYDDNATDLLGPGAHRGAFIERFNQRAQEYGEFAINPDGPSYPFMRHLGAEIQGVMGVRDENRWVIDQVMDVDGPEVYKQVKRVLRSLLA